MQKPDKAYLVRYRSIIRKLGDIKKMEPSAQYFFPLMDSVPFQDLEVAIILCKMAYEESLNDNLKNRP